MGVYIPNGRLPSAYQEVEFIQSSGTQYFVVGSSFKTSYKSVIDMEMVTTGGDYIPLGLLTNDASKRYGINAYGSYFKVIAGGSSWSNTKSEDKNRHIFTLNQSTATVDGTDYSMSYVNYTFSGGIGVFGYHNVSNDDVAYKASAKIYKLDIYDENGVHIYDLIPCYRKSDSVIGMYDIVNDTFYTNAGTGTFSKGADISVVELKNAYIGQGIWLPGANTVAYYPFKEDILDHSGNGNDWNVYSGSVSFSDGMVNITNRLNRGNLIYGIRNEFTLSVYTTVTQGEQYLYCSSDNKYAALSFGTNGDKWFVNQRWNNNVRYGANVTLPDNQVHLITSTRDGTTLKSYVDGVLEGSAIIDKSIVDRTYMVLGNVVNYSYTSKRGDLIIENKARTADEITTYYNNTKGNYGL